MPLSISITLYCSTGKPSIFSPFLMTTKAPGSFTETQNTETKQGCLGLHHMSLAYFLPSELPDADSTTQACLFQSAKRRSNSLLFSVLFAAAADLHGRDAQLLWVDTGQQTRSCSIGHTHVYSKAQQPPQ